MKQLSKKIVLAVLSRQVRRLLKRWQPKVVAVTGSYGKTSTKFAVAKVLKQKYRVHFQEGNYNDIVTVPLVLFDQPLPSLFNPFAWAWVFAKNELKLLGRAPYDVIVLELGTDGPGQVAAFGRYLKVDIAVVTAIAYEHMEFFADLDAIAKEELAVKKYSDKLVVNGDLCAQKYLKAISQTVETYGLGQSPAYRLKDVKLSGEHFDFKIDKHGKPWIEARQNAAAQSQLYSAASAAAVGNLLRMSESEIVRGIANIEPVPGRMQRLRGIKNSLILDDTYNSSPEATRAALDTLYLLKAPQKIALLGNMNELGNYSEEAHKEVGDYCEPEQLDLVVTLGTHANEFLAPAAHARGCRVVSFTSPYEAGEYLKRHIKPDAAVLIKGSQNGVFAEEAVKLLLANKADEAKLVRQSRHWLKVKKRQFGK